MGQKGSRVYGAGLAALLAATGLIGCSSKAEDAGGNAPEGYEQEQVGEYEAEDALFAGNVRAGADTAGHSGTGYATGFEEDGDSCTFCVEIPKDGFYDLCFYSTGEGYKENYVKVDGEDAGLLVTESEGFGPSFVERVYMAAGEHQVSVAKYWGWIDLDRLQILTAPPIDPAVYEVSARLCNENASEEAKRLMSYLCDNYGSRILSGQYCDSGPYGKEIQVIRKVTGKTPAVLGLDMIEYSPSRVEKGSSSKATEFALEQWEKGGIVTFCWHWNAPSRYLTGEWYKGFYTDSTNIDLQAIMEGRDEEGYRLLMEDIDAIAEQLVILRDAGVPILWRPLHEASGGWFWWGASGPEAYKKLYLLLYDRLTNEYGLNNLIWVWNGQDTRWYPGDEYVDVIGEDIYPGEKVYASQVNKYLQAVRCAGRPKLVALSENGCVPDPELMLRDGAMWSFWCTWGGEFAAKNMAIFSYNGQYTEEEALKRFYDNEAVITLEEVPDLSVYPMRETAEQ